MNLVKTPSADVIIHLSEEEQKVPESVFFNIYDETGLYYLRTKLWRYLKAATSESGWHHMRQPSDAVILHRRLLKLMEASWLLLQEKERRDGEVTAPRFLPGSEEWLEDDRQMYLEFRYIESEYEGSIQCLRQRELDCPMLVLKDFFNTLTLQEWRVLLEEWTEYALGKTSLFTETENFNLLQHYEQLERLIEVSYYFTLMMDGEEDILGSKAEQAPATVAVTEVQHESSSESE